MHDLARWLVRPTTAPVRRGSIADYVPVLCVVWRCDVRISNVVKRILDNALARTIVRFIIPYQSHVGQIGPWNNFLCAYILYVDRLYQLNSGLLILILRHHIIAVLRPFWIS